MIMIDQIKSSRVTNAHSAISPRAEAGIEFRRLSLDWRVPRGIVGPQFVARRISTTATRSATTAVVALDEW
jgi:hypothetical protein